jgi:hypothetical protein
MDTNGIIAEIDKQISGLQQAKAIFVSMNRTEVKDSHDRAIKRGPGRPKSIEPKVIKRKKRKMTAEGKAKIAAAQKARWAKVKKAMPKKRTPAKGAEKA